MQDLESHFMAKYHVSEEITNGILEFFKEYSQYSGRGLTAGSTTRGKDSTDISIDVHRGLPYNYPRTSKYPDPPDPRVLAYQMEIGKISSSYKRHFVSRGCGFKFNLAPTWNIQQYQPGEGFTEWHSERVNCESSPTNDQFTTIRRCLVFMTYFCDIEEGGGTEFLNQNMTLQCNKGDTYIWPSDWTHTHRGVVAPNDVKTIATGWFTLITSPNESFL